MPPRCVSNPLHCKELLVIFLRREPPVHAVLARLPPGRNLFPPVPENRKFPDPHIRHHPR